MIPIIPRRPRWLNRLHASLFGYFWLPCPICGKPFGGHEYGGTLMMSACRGVCVCRPCEHEAEERNRRNNWFGPRSETGT